MTKTSVVVTSISPPTIAIKRISELPHLRLIVVGDKKSPLNWECRNVDYLSLDDQLSLDYKIIPLLPFNHYSRKNIGYLYAISKGTLMIIDTDDDNIPHEKLQFPPEEGEFELTSKDLGFVNIYTLFSRKKIWPRGFPLDHINKSFLKPIESKKTKTKIGVWQGLANGDPDVDAVYRLVDNSQVVFKERDPIVLNFGTISPFNSQNTLFTKELFVLLYLPSFVSFRFTDILRSYIAQPIMWLYDYRLGFIGASVTQERNIHDFMNDFELEIPVYLNSAKIIDIVSSSISLKYSIEENLLNSYENLCIRGIVKPEEIQLVKNWIEDLKSLL